MKITFLLSNICEIINATFSSMINWFGYFKALHIIFMVSWFAGLFYMVRLFCYYSEAELNHKELSSAFKKQYLLMQKKIVVYYFLISMLLTMIFGVFNVVSKSGFFEPFLCI